MRKYFCLVILLSCRILFYAQAVSVQPDSVSQKLVSGYEYMLGGKPLLAQREYRKAVELDSSIVEAWQGLLWSYNGLKQWRLTTRHGKTAISLFPYDSRLPYLTAYAYWNRYNAMKAHQLYKTSLSLSMQKFDKISQISSLEGLGWIYNSYGNYQKASDAFNQAQAMYPDSLITPGLIEMSRVKYNTILAYANLNKQKTDVSMKQFITYKSSYLGAGFEQYRKQNVRYRDVWTAELGNQFKPVDVILTGFYLTGNTYLYPAYAVQTSFSHQFWASALMLEPAYRYAFTYYPDFNVYQNDLSLNVYWQKLCITTTVVNIQRDVENPGGDYLDWMFHSSLSYPLYKGVRGTVLTGNGKQDWWIIPGGYAVDDFKTVHLYYGNSWLIPLNNRMDIYLYQQYGKRTDTWNYSGSFALSLKY